MSTTPTSIIITHIVTCVLILIRLVRPGRVCGAAADGRCAVRRLAVGGDSLTRDLYTSMKHSANVEFPIHKHISIYGFVLISAGNVFIIIIGFGLLADFCHRCTMRETQGGPYYAYY